MVYWNDPQFNSPAQPVVGVSWYEAAAYCRWLSDVGHECGWLPADELIRLPTSMEWERAARHTDQRPFPWGDTAPTTEQANTEASGVGATSPVGCFPGDNAACGALDVAGNVGEWTSSDYQEIEATESKEDFTQDQGVDIRGGDWNNGLEWTFCGARVWGGPFSRDIYLGFRVVHSRALIR